MGMPPRHPQKGLNRSFSPKQKKRIFGDGVGEILHLIESTLAFLVARLSRRVVTSNTFSTRTMSHASGLVVPPGFKAINEGTASILYEADEKAGDKGEPVFYNKVQVFNRDLSIRVISQFARMRERERTDPKKGGRAKRRAAARAAAEAGIAGGKDASARPKSSAMCRFVSAPSGCTKGAACRFSHTEAEAAEAAAAEAAAAAAAQPADGAAPAATAASAEGGEVAAEGEVSHEDWDARLRAGAPEHGLRILDALAATGLRSIRYFKEIPGVKQVVTNDLDPAAVAAAERNVVFNGLTLDQVRCRHPGWRRGVRSGSM